MKMRDEDWQDMASHAALTIMDEISSLAKPSVPSPSLRVPVRVLHLIICEKKYLEGLPDRMKKRARLPGFLTHRYSLPDDDFIDH